MKDGPRPLSSSCDSVLAPVSAATSRLQTHAHALARLFFYTTHPRVFLTEIEVTSQQSHCKSILVASSENTHARTHTCIQFPVSGLFYSPNHSVTPPLLGSSFCLCFSSSMNFSCISSTDPSAGAWSFCGKMSGKVNVWLWA